MNDFNVNLETNHVNLKTIIAGGAIIFILIGSYLYMPAVFDTIFGVKSIPAPQVTTKNDKFKDLGEYADKTKNPTSRFDISSESFGRTNPFIDYQ